MRRSEIWWALVHPKARPVVLLSRDSLISVRAFITVAPVTTRVRNLRSEVALGPEDGLPKPCVVNASTLEMIPKSSLVRCLTSLSPSKREAVDDALRFTLGLD